MALKGDLDLPVYDGLELEIYFWFKSRMHSVTLANFFLKIGKEIPLTPTPKIVLPINSDFKGVIIPEKEEEKKEETIREIIQKKNDSR